MMVIDRSIIKGARFLLVAIAMVTAPKMASQSGRPYSDLSVDDIERMLNTRCDTTLTIATPDCAAEILKLYDVRDFDIEICHQWTYIRMKMNHDSVSIALDPVRTPLNHHFPSRHLDAALAVAAEHVCRMATVEIPLNDTVMAIPRLGDVMGRVTMTDGTIVRWGASTHTAPGHNMPFDKEMIWLESSFSRIVGILKDGYY